MSVGPKSPTQDEAFAALENDHQHMASEEVREVMHVLRDLLRDRYEVTGNGFGCGEADVSINVKGRHIWITIKDVTPEVKQ